MNERDWLILVLLREKLNISQTAEALFLSQSTLSLRIKYIEKYFGVPLIIRNSKGISFTKMGEKVTDFAVTYLRELQQFKQEIADLKEQDSEELIIALPPVLTRLAAPSIIAQFHRLHPGIVLKMLSRKNDEIIHGLETDEVQFGIIRIDAKLNGFVQHTLSKERLLLVCKKPFTIEDLSSMDYIDYRTDPKFQAQFTHWWKTKFGSKLPHTIVVTDPEACKELIRQGMGFGFFPEILLLKDKDLYCLPAYTNTNKLLLRKTRLVYKQEAAKTRSAKLFLEFMKKYVNQLNEHHELLNSGQLQIGMKKSV